MSACWIGVRLGFNGLFVCVSERRRLEEKEKHEVNFLSRLNKCAYNSITNYWHSSKVVWSLETHDDMT